MEQQACFDQSDVFAFLCCAFSNVRFVPRRYPAQSIRPSAPRSPDRRHKSSPVQPAAAGFWITMQRDDTQSFCEIEIFTD